jgi:PPOX class probable F420-dependent enzyme
MFVAGQRAGRPAEKHCQFGSERTESAALVPPGGAALRYRLRMTRPNALEESPVPVPLPDELLDLLGRPSLCFVATVMPDGSPQLTQTWVSTDGGNILINTPDHSQKARNVARDPRVAVNVVDPGSTRRYFAVRGRVIATTTEGGAQSIDEISGKYLGRPYPNFGGGPETRMIMTVEAASVRGMGAR